MAGRTPVLHLGLSALDAVPSPGLSIRYWLRSEPHAASAFVALSRPSPTPDAVARRETGTRVARLSSVLTAAPGPCLRSGAARRQPDRAAPPHRRAHRRAVPSKPTEDPFVRAGTYEIQATPSRVALWSRSRRLGLVLAALAPRAYRFDEFVRAAAWDPDALAPSWDGSDSEASSRTSCSGCSATAISLRHCDVHGRAACLRDAARNARSSIPLYRRAPTCTFIGFNRTCSSLWRYAIRSSRRASATDGSNHRGRPHEAPAAAPTSTIALSMRGSSATAVIPRDGRAGGGLGSCARRRLPATGRSNRARERRSLFPRTGESAAASGALGPGRPALASARHDRGPNPAPRRGRAGRAGVRSGSQPDAHTHTCAEEPAEVPQSSGSLVLTGLTVSPPVQPAPASRMLASRREALDAQATAPLMVRERGLAVAGSGSRAGGEGRRRRRDEPRGSRSRRRYSTGPSACARYAYGRSATLTDETHRTRNYAATTQRRYVIRCPAREQRTT